MKKAYWQVIIAIISCGALYQLAAGCNFSHIKRLSPDTLGTVLLLCFAYSTADIIYLNILLKASSAFTGFKNTLLLYCSSHVIGTLTTYYVGLASFIIMIKKTARTTYKHALTCSFADLFIRYSLRLVFAGIGVALVLGWHFFLLLMEAALLVLLSCLLFKKKLAALSYRIQMISTLMQYCSDMKTSLAGFSMRNLTALFLFAFVHLFIESIIFYYILKQFGYEYDLMLILSIRSLGLFIGYLSFLPTLSVVEDLGVIGLWMLMGMDQSIAFLAAVINRIFVTVLPACCSLIFINICKIRNNTV